MTKEEDEIKELMYRMCEVHPPSDGCGCKRADEIGCPFVYECAEFAYDHGARLPDPVDELEQAFLDSWCNYSYSRATLARMAAQIAVARGAK